MCFGVVGKVEMGSCIKKKYPNRARSCLRQSDMLWLVAQMPLVVPQGWGWAGFVPPRGSLQRGAPISASPSFQPPVAILAGAAPCRVPVPGASRAGGSGQGKPLAAGLDVWPWAPTTRLQPLPHPGHPPPGSTALPRTAGTACFCLAGSAQGRLALININTASAAPSPPF